jgi:hypothetical protein
MIMSIVENVQTRATAAPQPFLWTLLHQVSGVALLGLVGTLIGAYFQNLSAYQDKVSSLAQSDMAAATQVFVDTSNALSLGMTLQQHLIDDFFQALPNDLYKDDTSFFTKDARASYEDYTKAYSALHQNYNLLPRKAELYLDWASDTSRDAAQDSTPSTDPISMSILGAYNFDCEKNMPAFTVQDHLALLPDPNGKNPKLEIDWLSAQHNVFAMEYCFDTVHRRMIAVLQWASQSKVDTDQIDYMKARADLFHTDRPTSQVLRLNAFMSLAMSQIEKIRVKYRPNSYACSVPVVNAHLNKCAPVKTSGG